MSTGTLLVCSPAVLERMKALNGVTPPPWVDIAEVTDVELKAAGNISLVYDQHGEGQLSRELLQRARLEGKTNDHLKVSEIAGLEERATALVRHEETKQREENTRARRRLLGQRNALEEQAAKDLATHRRPEVVALGDELDLEMPEEEWLIEGLFHDGGRVVIGGFRKSGKTVFEMNMGAAIVTGEPFLGYFAVRTPDPEENVGWLNLELTRTSARKWTHALGTWVPREALNRIVAVHLRGAVSTFAVTTKTGEEALYRFLCEHRIGTLFVDPVGPMMAVCGLEVNSDRDVGRYLTTMDRILDRAETRQAAYAAHIGKASAADDGNEMVKGDTRWEDSVDSIIILGKERNSGTRWIRAEGRDVSIDNATLIYNEETRRLSLDPLVSRRDAELRACAEQVLTVVRTHPGIQTEALLGNPVITGTKGKRKAGRDEAVKLGWIDRRPGEGTAVEHWPLV